MSYVLVAYTRGDDLIRPKQYNIATADDRWILERLRDERAKEREAYLATHSVPWWQQGDVISREEIQEVQKV